MSRKILFVDRDGCLIEEPADQQIDSYEKLALLPGVIAALQRFVGAGYELVLVSNQDGLGTDSFPQAHFDGPHALLLRILASQGIRFREQLIDRSFAHEGLDTRKPVPGLRVSRCSCAKLRSISCSRKRMPCEARMRSSRSCGPSKCVCGKLTVPRPSWLLTNTSS